MTTPLHPQPQRIQRLRTLTAGLLAGSLLISGGFHSLAFSQFGPKPPVKRQAAPASTGEKLDKLKNSFTRMFTPQEGAENSNYEDVEVKRGAGMPGQFDTIRVRRTKEGPAAKRIQHPSRPQLLSQPPLRNPKVMAPTVSSKNPPIKRTTLDNPSNPLGISVARKRLNATAALIEAKNYSGARFQLESLKKWLTETTENHISLYKALNNIPSARLQAELEKQVALDFARMRDTSFFQLGRVHLAEHNTQEGIKLLIQVIQSQPRSHIGLKSYELLQEIGFTQKLQLVE